MKKLEIPGLIALLIGTIATALINYFSLGGAGFEWAYAPIAVIVLGGIVKVVEVNTVKPEPTQPAAQERGADGTVTAEQPSKVQRFLLG